MNTCSRLLSSLLLSGLLILVFLSPTAGASRASSSKAHHMLPLSPLSGGVLMAQALHSGAVHLAGRSSGQAHLHPQLTCSPAPCILPLVQASPGGQPVNEDPIAANPISPKRLLSGGNDYNCASIQGFYASSNAGTTWNHSCMNVLGNTFGCGDPGVGYDRHNIAYITGIDCLNAGGSVVAFEKSPNNGITWTPPALAVPPTFPGGFVDKPWLQIDDNATSPRANTLYISATQLDTNTGKTQISVSHSTNGGANWITKLVDPVQSPPYVDQFSDLTIGKTGTVYVTWMSCSATGPTNDCGGSYATFWLSKSFDGGNTWSQPMFIEYASLAPDTCGAYYGCLPGTSERVSDIPAIGIDNSNGFFAGRLYVVTYTWTGSFMQVQVTTSTNGGNTWSFPVAVAPAMTHDQFFPWLSVSSSGIIGVSWLDRRNDNNNLFYQAFAALSTNGGSNFGANIQLTPFPSFPSNDGFNGSFMGDYTGNIWVGNTLFVSWMDSSNGVNMQDEVGGYRAI